MEQPHATICDAMMTMLLGEKFDLKYWPYAFYHYICLYNIIPHGSSILTPFEQVTGKRPNLSSLKTFGCWCYVRLPGCRPAKLETHSQKGIFWGYTATMKNIYYLDLDSNRIKTALHARFNKGMNDLHDPTPNSRQMRLAMGRKLPEDTIFTPAPVSLALDIVSSPFLDPINLTIPIKCSTKTMGFIIESCSIRGRGYLVGLQTNSTASGIRGRNKKLVGSYIIQVNDTTVYSKDDILEAIGICSELAVYDKSPQITLTFAMVKSSP